MNQAEFEALIGDTSKSIAGDIKWTPDEDHSPAVEFRADVYSDAGWPIFIKGSCNRLAQTLTYALVHQGKGRIYALDLGKQHQNPDGALVGEKHKHRWNDRTRDKEAYVPPDITAAASDPVAVWQQFCREANIMHDGRMGNPPDIQMEMPIP